MIYTDGRRICAGSHEELMLFARDMGMSQGWYIEKETHGYFEIFGNMRKKILRLGDRITYIARAEFVIKAKQMYDAKNNRP